MRLIHTTFFSFGGDRHRKAISYFWRGEIVTVVKENSNNTVTVYSLTSGEKDAVKKNTYLAHSTPIAQSGTPIREDSDSSEGA